jgi:hypothetical protein
LFLILGPIITLSNDTLSSNTAVGGNGGNGGAGASGGYDGGSGGKGGAGSGGGLDVAGGTVTLNNDTLSSNNANGGIGGIGGIGGHPETGSPIGIGGGGGNGGAGSGGGLDVAGGTVKLNNDTLSSNNVTGGKGGAGGSGGIFGTGHKGNNGGNGGSGGAGSGGGLYLAGGSVTLNNDTLSNNYATGGTGGTGGKGSDCLFGNGGNGGVGGVGGTGSGGGLYVSGGTVNLNNDTLSSNNANGGIGGNGGTGGKGGSHSKGGNGGNGGVGGTGSGGSLYVAKGTVTLNNDTLSRNSALAGLGGEGGSGGSVFNGGKNGTNGSGGSGGTASGGGIDVVSGAKVLLHNTLIAGSLAGGNSSDISGSLNSASDYNLISDGSGGLSTVNHNRLGSSAHPINPLLAPLGNYGGPTQTMALLPGSLALNAGSSAYGGSSDQRGKPRVGATDIGAFESQGFKLTLSSGNNQSAAVNTAFAKALVVTVSANNALEPVAGGVIAFKAPVSGASAVLKSSPATIGSNGQASVAATANGTAGTYAVNASASGIASPVRFSLTNTAPTLPSFPTAVAEPTSGTSPPSPTPSPSLSLVDAALALFLDSAQRSDKWMEGNASFGEAFYW